MQEENGGFEKGGVDMVSLFGQQYAGFSSHSSYTWMTLMTYKDNSGGGYFLWCLSNETMVIGKLVF